MASKHHIVECPKYCFRGSNHPSGGGIMTQYRDPRTQYFLPSKDAKCCICLSAYDNGAVLRELPCGHHFHCACIDDWLRSNPTCPLCKFNIRSSRKLPSRL